MGVRETTAVLKTGEADSRVLRCRRKFLRFYPGGFRDPDYVGLERDYKWQAHVRWHTLLAPAAYRALLKDERYADIAAHAVRVESRTNLLFSFEKMALRDAVKGAAGSRIFAEGLYEFLYGRADLERRFENWCDAIAELPRIQTRVLTWPVATVFGFIAEPASHMFMKPNVTRAAAQAYGYDFRYLSKPSWAPYASLLDFAATVRRGQRELKPRDMIDLQSFIWVQGSDEYAE